MSQYWARKDRFEATAKRCARGLVRAAREGEPEVWHYVDQGFEPSLATVKVRDDGTYIIVNPATSEERQTADAALAADCLIEFWRQTWTANAKSRGALEALLRRRSIELGEPKLPSTTPTRNPDKNSGRLQAKFTIEPFSTLSGQKWKREETISVVTLKLARCNTCGAFSILRSNENIYSWVEGRRQSDGFIEDGDALKHEPNCPLAGKEVK